MSVTLVDDLNGSEATDTISFGLDGKSYEIDLSGENAAKLRDVFAPFVGAGRRDDGRRRTTPTPRTTPSSVDRDRTDAIREWARKNGHEVAQRGRIPRAVIEAFDNRGSAPVAEVGAPKKTRKRKLQAAS